MLTVLPPAKSTKAPILLIGCLFFVFGFITWLNSILIPYLKIACELSNLESYLVAFSFYISYLTMAVPSGKLLKITGFKKGMSFGLLAMAVGASLFIPAAMTRIYPLFLAGLFIQGTGLTLLQTAANPYITVLGPLASAARRISIMGICNKVAGVIAPIILGTIVLKNTDSLKVTLQAVPAVEKARLLNELATKVIIPYGIIVLSLLVLGLIIFWSPLPEIDTDKEPVLSVASRPRKMSVVQFPQLVSGVMAMFFYVGVEVIAGDTIVSYGATQNIALSTARFFSSLTLISMIAGYLVGVVCIPRYFSQNAALKASALTGLVLSVLAFSLKGYLSVFSIALLGLANALIFPAIWPQALTGLGRFTKMGASLLVMAIAGGAILPLLYGALSDFWNPHAAYILLIPCYIVIWFYGTMSKPAKPGTIRLKSQP